MKSYHENNNILLARHHYEQGDLIRAKRLYEKAVSNAKTNTEWLLELALLYDELEDYDSADDLYDQVLAINPEEAVAYYGKAILLDHRDDFRGAIPWYQRTIACDSDFMKAHFFLAFAYDQTGQADLAAASYEQGCQQGQGHHYG